MGCGCCQRSETKDIKPPYYDAFLDILNNNNYIKDNLYIKENKYLVKTKSIKSFVTIIKETGVLSNMKNNKDLKRKLYDYTLEKNIEIICDFEEGNNMINAGEDNEFIIVDKEFFENMEADNLSDLEQKNVEVLKENNKLMVTFLVSHNELGITDENNYGFYKFIK